MLMQVLKGDLSDVKGIPPSGLCVGVHRAGAVHQKMVAKHGAGLAVWSLRPDLDFIAFKKEGLGEQGIRSTSDMESIDAGEKLIYGVRGAPPEVREKAREKGLTLLADATCPFVTQQEEAELELLNAGFHLVVLSSRTHHAEAAGHRASEGERGFHRRARGRSRIDSSHSLRAHRRDRADDLLARNL
jgi:4-hydroxy-3-methylbut-2-enyl diphosphate reductase IspH